MTNAFVSAIGARCRRAVPCAVAALLLLAGCRSDLYTKQTEADANEMVAALQAQQVDAEKTTPDGGKTWSVTIEQKDIGRAVSVLRANGLPHDRFSGLGELFKKEGLVSTPTEERVRFIHGVSEELAGTLCRIDGVITARVHIVLPQNDPLAATQKPSSASVFVKHRPEANLGALVPAIKNMVARSVEGLVYDNVSVTLVAGEMMMPAKPQAAAFPWLWVLGAVLFLSTAGAAAALYWLRPSWLPAAIAKRLPARPARADAAMKAT